MAPHLSRSDLVRALSRGGAHLDVDAAIPHLLACRPCQELAAAVVEELRESSALVPLSEAWISLLTLFEEEDRQALDRLSSEGWWAELRNLAPGQQRERIRSVLTLQTQRMFEVVISDASLLASNDPHLGEETALTARVVAELLPSSRYSQELKNDLQAEAMIVVGNCRRLAADWSGSQAALREAEGFRGSGTGDPKHKGRLLSVSASLATDTGNFEAALRMLTQAAECYRKRQDSAGLASVAVKEAGTLMAAARFESAISRANEALKILSSKNARLEMLARSIITACLIDLKRPAQALRSFEATRPLYDQLRGQRNHLDIVGYLEARLLDSFGYARESEKAFRELIKADLEEGLYKNAFIHTLTLFESLHKRGALAKAVDLCNEASNLLDTPFCHSQMRQVWEELLTQVKAQAVTVGKILEVRLYTLRHWSVPAAGLPISQAIEIAIPSVQEQPARPVESTKPADLPPVPDQLANGGYEGALDAYDRKLIAAALAQTGGNITETSRLLRMSRNGLKTKLKKLGLATDVPETRRPRIKTAGPRRRSTYGKKSPD